MRFCFFQAHTPDEDVHFEHFDAKCVCVESYIKFFDLIKQESSSFFRNSRLFQANSAVSLHFHFSMAIVPTLRLLSTAAGRASNPIRWGILSAGRISSDYVQAIRASDGAEVGIFNLLSLLQQPCALFNASNCTILTSDAGSSYSSSFTRRSPSIRRTALDTKNLLVLQRIDPQSGY